MIYEKQLIIQYEKQYRRRLLCVNEKKKYFLHFKRARIQSEFDWLRLRPH